MTDGNAMVARVVLLVLIGCTACSAAQQVPPQLATGERVPIEGTTASIVVPRGFAKLDEGTWGIEVDRGRTIVLKVQRTMEPVSGAQAHIDHLVADMHRQGNEDLERDAWVPLGDLQGRMLQVVELRGEEPASLWLIVLVAEDGLYTATATGPAVELRSKRLELEGFLKSLRVPLPAGGIVQPAVPKDDPLGIEPPGSVPEPAAAPGQASPSVP